MKYGAHVFLWLEHYGDDELAAVLERAAALKLSFLEVSVGDDLHFDAGLLGRRALALDLELVVSPGGHWPLRCDLSLPRAEDRRAALQWHRDALERCGACGAVAYAGAIYGHPGRVGSGPPARDEKRRIAEGLRELAENGERVGTRIVLEPMSHFRTHVANTPAQINELIALAQHPNLGSLLDTYHLVTEVADFRKAVLEMLPHLWAIHACENTRGLPGSGIIPWEDVLGPLKERGWDARVGFESYNSSVRDGAFARSRGLFHNVCPDGDEFVRAARSFIEGRWASC